MLLTIECAGDRFSIPARLIREIVPSEPITPQPHFPEFVLGVTRIRGETIPVVDLALLLEHEEAVDRNERTCFVVVRTEGCAADDEFVALVVDRILHSETVTLDRIKPLSLVGGHDDVPHIKGLLQVTEGVSANLDLPVLFRSMKFTSGEAEDGFKATTAFETATADQAANASDKVLTIHVGGQRLGVPLREVGRLLAPGPPVADDEGPSGAQVVRNTDGTLFMGIDLASALSFDRQERESQGERLALVHRDDSSLAFLVDSIGALCEADREKINEAASELGTTGKARIGFVDCEDEPLEIISLERILTAEQRAACDQWWVSMRALERLSNKRVDVEEEVEIKGDGNALAGSYLIIDCGPHRMGIAASLIQEVISDSVDLPVRGARRDLVGLIDLRGHSLPVVDLCTRLGLLQSDEVQGRSCIVVIHDGDGWTGVRVDRVVEWARLEAASFVERAEIAVQAHPRFFSGVSLHDSHEVHIVELPALLEDEGLPYRQMMEELGFESARIEHTDGTSSGSGD